MKLDSLIEAVLYFKGEPVSKKEILKILEISSETLNEALKILREKLTDRGIVLIESDSEVSLGTSPEASEVIEKLRKEDLEKDLGKAGLETLTIVAYKGPIGRNSIDNIRGVNSSFILRNLMIRGLVERVGDPKDQRAYLYKPSLDLLKYLGIEKVEDLPEYANVITKLEEFAADSKEGEDKPEFLPPTETKDESI